MRKGAERRISFVTGINENYFLMCGVLMESLERHFPLLPLHVMDFGLSDAQREFFRLKDMLLPLPPGLSARDHPYKLKGAMRDFLGDRFDAPVWIDADIIALRDGTAELEACWEQMESAGKRMAVTICHGRPDGAPETFEFVTGAQPMPRLRAYMQSDPALARRLYVNAALMLFRSADVISGWRAATDAYEGDACWEQNALNAILAPDLGDALVLDARVWNMHGALIDRIGGDPGHLRCGGERTVFAHAASPIIGHLDEGQMDLHFGGHTFRNFLKLFRHEGLRSRQMELLNAFLGNHLALLAGLGIPART
jgi:hypothetical protein